MHLGYCTYQIRLYGVVSLKDKRGIVRPLLSDLKKNFNASVVETGRQDSREDFEISVAMIANSRGELDSLFNSVAQRILWNGLEIAGEFGESW
jgi:hypothetical protein